MSNLQLKFAVNCSTNFGQHVIICGDIPALGLWNPAEGLKLETDQTNYPLWKSSKSLSIRKSTTLEFKVCILSSQGQAIKWEQGQNRILRPKYSLIIQFTFSCPKLICRGLRKSESSEIDLPIVNVRKGTTEIINSLDSDSSSNHGMWPEPAYQREQYQSLIVTALKNEFRRTEISPLNNDDDCLEFQPDVQLHNRCQFGNYNKLQNQINYFILSKDLFNEFKPISKEGSRILCLDQIKQLQINSNIYTLNLLFLKVSEVSQVINQLQSKYLKDREETAIQRVVIVYFQQIKENDMKILLQQKLDSYVFTNRQLLVKSVFYLQKQEYKILNGNKNQFYCYKNNRRIKIIWNQKIKQNKYSKLNDISQNILKDYYQRLNDEILQQKFKKFLKIHKPKKMLLFIKLQNLQELHGRTITRLIELSSKKHETIVVILLNQKFDNKILSKVNLSKNKLIIINIWGQIYTYKKKIQDLFTILELSVQKFKANMCSIIQNVGTIIQQYKYKNNKIQFSYQKQLKKLINSKLKKLIKQTNKKSINKIILQQNKQQNFLIPFIYNSQFLIKSTLSMFNNSLKPYEKGLVIFASDQQFKIQKHFNSYNQIQLNFIQIRLSNKIKTNYDKPTIKIDQLNTLTKLIIQHQQQSKKIWISSKNQLEKLNKSQSDDN